MSANSKTKIGVFDSGIGGLTVAREIKNLLPDCQLLYIADSAFTPYGDKSAQQIIERCQWIVAQLYQLGADAIVVACNTATALAVDSLRQSPPGAEPGLPSTGLPIVAMEPAVKPAVKNSAQRRVGILATTMTLSSQRYAHLLERYAEGAEVIEQPCPGLVEQVENLDTGSSRTRELLASYISPLLERQVDTLVLGCTHYPLLRDSISRIAGDQVQIMDTGEAVAREVARRLQLPVSNSQTNQPNNQIGPQLWQTDDDRFLTSGEQAHFQQQLAHYWPVAVKAEKLPD